jgi:hypothetical protein
MGTSTSNASVGPAVQTRQASARALASSWTLYQVLSSQKP